jgi:hypothetical protein
LEDDSWIDVEEKVRRVELKAKCRNCVFLKIQNKCRLLPSQIILSPENSFLTPQPHGNKTITGYRNAPFKFLVSTRVRDPLFCLFFLCISQNKAYMHK